MPKNPEFVNFILEQMAPLGDIRARVMFGGHGIYQGDTMFAIIVDGELYLKVDELTRDEYLSRGLQPFTYESRRKIVSMHYYAAPPEVFDEAEAMLHWARQAIATAVRANRDKKPSSRKRGH
jgi:DNA transformation protein and related proteins